MGRFRAVFLDAGGTLLQLAAEPHQVYADILREHGYELTPRQARDYLDLARRQAAERCPPPPSPPLTISAEHQAALRRTMVERFLDLAGVQRHRTECLAQIEQSWTGARIFALYPEVPQVLRELKQAGLAVGVISNWESRLDELLASHGVRDQLDFLVVSEIEGVMKPAPRLYQIALERSGLRPDEVLHAGDSLDDDVRPAEALGIRAVHLARNGQPRQHSPTVRTLEPLVPLATAEALLRGRVAHGKGEARRFTDLDWVRAQLVERLGLEVFPGTLNLKLEEPRDVAEWERVRRRPGVPLEPQPGYCAARCYPGWAEGEVPCAIVLPLVAGYPSDQIELLCPFPLRQALELADGDLLSLAVL